MNQNTQSIYIGRYSDTQGISAFAFNSENGELKAIEDSDYIPNSSYLYQQGSILYAVIETHSYRRKNGGAAACFRIDTANHCLKLMNIQNTYGQDPCHLITDKSRSMLICANYTEGSFSCFPLQQDGSIGTLAVQQVHKGKGFNVQRQEKAHVHFVTFTPDDRFLCVVDLGLDKIIGYQIARENDDILLNEAFQTNLPPGTGPRHMVFSKDGKRAYVIGELSNEVFVFDYSDENGFRCIQAISALQGADVDSSNTGAAIKMSKDGKYIYTSIRGQDIITVFHISQASGKLNVVQQISCAGKSPRDISLDETEQWLFSANTASNAVSIFKREPNTGILTFDRLLEDIESPTCILCVS